MFDQILAKGAQIRQQKSILNHHSSTVVLDSSFFNTTFNIACSNFAVTFTPVKNGYFLKCYPLMHNHPHCRTLIFRCFGNGPVIISRLMCRRDCSSKSIAYVIPLWHCVNSHLTVPYQQTAKTFVFLEVCTPSDDHLSKG